MKRGEMFFTDGNTDEAMKCFSTILDIEHSSGKTHSHMATLYWKRNDRVNALKHIKEAIKFSPCDSDVVWNYGHIMTERGQKSDAFKAYKEYLSKNPHDAEIKSLFDKLVKEEEIRKASSHEKKKKDKKKKKK
jgi:Tfp pilus assembly protein PilF